MKASDKLPFRDLTLQARGLLSLQKRPPKTSDEALLPFADLLFAAARGELPVLPDSRRLVLETGQQVSNLNTVVLAYADGVRWAFTDRGADTMAVNRYLGVLQRCEAAAAGGK